MPDSDDDDDDYAVTCICNIEKKVLHGERLSVVTGVKICERKTF